MSDAPSDSIDFQVIGELKGDPNHLLLLGDDRHWYDFEIVSGAITRIEPSDAWAIDITDRVALRLEVPKDILAS